MSNPPHIKHTILALALALTPALAGTAHAASPVPLGSAESFALLGGSTITNTGSTSISGDIGLCCTGIATTGFGPGADQVNQPSGATYIGTGTPAATAQNDLDIAYANAAGRAVTNTVDPDLSLAGTPANPLLPGVYRSTSRGALQINTGLTLDFQGDPNAVFIFQGTGLITAAGSDGSVNIVNGGAAPSTCNITWQLSDATQGVTLGTNSAFKGTTMALGASVLGTGATVEGRILTRRSKAVNLDTNTITRSACFSAAPSPDGGGGVPASDGGAGPGAGRAPGGAIGFVSAPAADLKGPLVKIFGLPGVRRPPTHTPGARRPPAGSVCTTRNFTARIRIRDRSGIKLVKVYIDGKLVKRTSRTRFSLRIKVRGLRVGRHRITVIAHDRVGNRSVTRRRFGRCTIALTAPHFAG